MDFFSIFTDPSVYSTNSSGDGYAVISTGKTALLQLFVTNTTSSIRFVQIFDSATGPGTHPLLELQLAANTQGTLELLASHWLPLTNGLVVASSSTAATYTAGGGTDLYITAFFIQR